MKHGFGPSGPTSKGSGHPIMYGKPREAVHFSDFPDGGGYPHGFVEWAMQVMGANDPSQILHLCSGSMKTGVRVDIRASMSPDVVCDCTSTPFEDESFDFIMADPPYSEEYAKNLYGTESAYPKPGRIAAEACRLLRPGGMLGLLHFQVPMTRKPMRIVAVYGITQGAGYAIRAWTLMQKAAHDAP